MTEIMRQAPRIVAIIGELVSACVAQHVGMNTEGELGSNTRALNHPQEPSCGYWRAGLSGEHIRPVALELA
jgi:hypothetical protein